MNASSSREHVVGYFIDHLFLKKMWKPPRVRRMLKRLEGVYEQHLQHELGKDPRRRPMYKWTQETVRSDPDTLTVRAQQARDLLSMLAGVRELQNLLARSKPNAHAKRAVGLAFMALRPDPDLIAKGLRAAVRAGEAGFATSNEKRRVRGQLVSGIERLLRDDRQSDLGIAKKLRRTAEELQRTFKSTTGTDQQKTPNKLKAYLVAPAKPLGRLLSERRLRQLVAEQRQMLASSRRP